MFQIALDGDTWRYMFLKYSGGKLPHVHIAKTRNPRHALIDHIQLTSFKKRLSMSNYSDIYVKDNVSFLTVIFSLHKMSAFTYL